LTVGGSVAIAVLATYLIRRAIPEDLHKSNNEVAGFMFAGVAVIYGVLLAFIFLVVWQAFIDAQNIVGREANNALNLYRLGQELPEPFGQDLRTGVENYLQLSVDNEWPTMARGQADPATANAMEDLWKLHRAFDASGLSEHDEQTTWFSMMDSLSDDRASRLLSSHSELPALMWVLVWGGGAITLAFTLFFRVPDFRFHYMMSGAFAALAAFAIFLIIELNSPFAGSIAVSPDSFQQAIAVMQQLGGK